MVHPAHRLRWHGDAILGAQRLAVEVAQDVAVVVADGVGLVRFDEVVLGTVTYLSDSI